VKTVAATPTVTTTPKVTVAPTQNPAPSAGNAGFDAGVVYKEIRRKKVGVDYTDTVGEDIYAMDAGVRGNDVFFKLLLEKDFDLNKNKVHVDLGPIDQAHGAHRFTLIVDESDVKVYERKLIDPGTFGEPQYAPQYKAHLLNSGKEIILGVENIWDLVSVNIPSCTVPLSVMGEGLGMKLDAGGDLAEPQYGFAKLDEKNGGRCIRQPINQ